jgi:hypothetical protein
MMLPSHCAVAPKTLRMWSDVGSVLSREMDGPPGPPAHGVRRSGKRNLGPRRRHGPLSYLRIAEGFPSVLVHEESAERVEIDLTNALARHLQSVQDQAATRLELDDLPTVRVVRLYLSPPVV